MGTQKTYEPAVRRHIEQWREKLTTAGQTKKQMAEPAIRDFYMRVQKREPDLILWCQSPYQMKVLPPLITSILASDLWKQMLGALEGSPVGSPRWERVFEREWCKIELAFSDLMDRVLNRPRQFTIAGIAQDNCRQRLRKLCYQVLVSGKFRENLIESTQPSNTPKLFRTFKPSQEFSKYLTGLQAAVEAAAGLPLSTLPIENREEIPEAAIKAIEALNVAGKTAMGLRHGVWDSRLLTELVPGSKVFLRDVHDEATLKAAADVKSMCAELERLSQQHLLWLRRQPAGTLRVTDQTEYEKFIDEWTEDQQRRRSQFDKFVGAVHMSFEGFNRMREAISEDLAFHNQAIWWFPHATAWLYFAQACCYIKSGFFGAVQDDIDILAYLSHGAACYTFLPNVCFACEKPTSFSTNAAGRIHNSEGHAVGYADGLKTYSWRGVPIPPELLNQRQTITVQSINDELNAERKRVLIDIYGESRYLLDAGAKVVHADECGTLYRVDVLRDEPLVMVKVKNSTKEPDGTYKYYFLRVPPTMTRARQAVAWTFGLEEDQYVPNFES